MASVTTVGQKTRVCMNLRIYTAVTLGGLRILSISGVCLLRVIARSEKGRRFFTLCVVSLKTKMPFNFIFHTALIHCSAPVILQACWSHTVRHPPGVASSTHAAAVTEEEQQGEQDQRPPGKNTQQHQQQHIVLHLARRHRHILIESSQEKRLGH